MAAANRDDFSNLIKKTLAARVGHRCSNPDCQAHTSGPQADAAKSDLKEIRDGLGQLQQAVDAIAIEVERLSEGHRFTTKLLAEGARGIAPIPAKHVAE